jgi:aromatic ring-opening dioxygenase catalytic subunit (LigB family)
MRLITDDGSQKVDHGRWMTINLLLLNKDFEVITSYIMLKITILMSYYQVSQKCRYTDRCSMTGMAPPNQGFNHIYDSE